MSIDRGSFGLRVIPLFRCSVAARADSTETKEAVYSGCL